MIFGNRCIGAVLFYFSLSFSRENVEVEALPVEYYSNRYDHLDLDTILNNRRMVNYYATCLLSHGPCPPEGVELKRILPEALRTNCLRCTERQKTVTYRSIKRLQKEYPQIWEQLTALWDPENVYVAMFEGSFEQQNAIAPPTVVTLGDRFGGADETSSTEPPTSTTESSTETTASTTPTSTTSGTTSTIAPALTNKPISTFKITQSTGRPPYPKPPPPPPPFGTLGSNIQATVSFGTNLVGGLVRTLGDIGNQVVQTGSKFANAVISAVIPRK